MIIDIDSRLCKAYANCTFEAPEIFEVDLNSGKARVLLDLVPESRRIEIERAIEACPMQAIHVAD